MYRRVVISSKALKKGPFDVLYYVNDAYVVSQRKRIRGTIDYGVPFETQQVPNVFYNVVRLQAQGSVIDKVSYEFVLDVAENQPHGESVKENSATGVTITVYNANGVVVCHNGVGISAESSPAQTVVPGEMTSESIGGTSEMTSESIDGTGEMTSEPIDAPGEMTSEPIEAPGEMASEPIDGPGEMM